MTYTANQHTQPLPTTLWELNGAEKRTGGTPADDRGGKRQKYS